VSPLEIFAAAVGAWSVWLSVRQNVLSWPTAIVNVVLYTIVFYEAKLYADMGLQVVYAVLSVYGWYQWLYGGEGHTTLHVSRTTRSVAIRLALPFMDSALTSASLVAQWMMTRKLLENWAVWIAVDVLYVGMFIYKGLYVTAVLYAVFLGLAVKGWIDWRKSIRAESVLATA